MGGAIVSEGFDAALVTAFGHVLAYVQGAFQPGFQSGVFLSAALLGLAGGLHCVGMCGAVGGALCGGVNKPAFRWWNVARVLSYGVGGALAGGGAQWMLGASTRWPALQAVWVMLQFAALAVALVMLFAPRALGWSGLAGRSGWVPVRWVPVRWVPLGQTSMHASAIAGNAPGFVAMRATAVQGLNRARRSGNGERVFSIPSLRRSSMDASGGASPTLARLSGVWGAMTGLLWTGFPCGLLHGALLMAWMSGSAAGGAFVMIAFGTASSAWLMAGGGLLQRLKALASGGGGGAGRWAGLMSETGLRRLTGAVLLLSWLAMAWAVAQGRAAGVGLGLCVVS